MPAIYLCNVRGDGQEFGESFAPDIGDAPYVCLMIHPGKGKAIIGAGNNLSGPGITKLLEAPTRAELIEAAKTTSPTTAQRNAINTWLANNGFEVLIPAHVTWRQVIEYAARQVNTAADMEVAG